MNKNGAKYISVCGIMAALAVVILFLAGITGIGTYAGPILASITLIPVMTEFGTKAGILVYVGVSILSILIMPDREMAIFWIIFAWYPLSLPYINKIKVSIVKILLKLAIFAGMVFLLYGVVKGLLGIPVEAVPTWLVIVLAILGAVAFLVMEFIYARIQQIWKQKLSKIIK